MDICKNVFLSVELNHYLSLKEVLENGLHIPGQLGEWMLESLIMQRELHLKAPCDCFGDH